MNDFKQAETQLKRLAERLGGDAMKWEITKWSPGDGWTRYRLECQGRELSPALSKQEFIAFVDGMIALDYHLYNERNKKDHPNSRLC